MIERINFLEKELFVLTYLKIGQWMGLMVGVLALLYGLQLGRVHSNQVQVDRRMDEVNQLKTQREKFLVQGNDKTALTQGDQTIRQYFEKSFEWSGILGELTKIMPAGLWLVSLKSYAKSDMASGHGLILSGEAEDPQQIPIFLHGLATSKYFENPVLTISKQEKRGTGKVYTYTIDSGLALPDKGGEG